VAIATLPGTSENRLLRGLRRALGSQEMVLLLAIVVLLLMVGTINPRFVAERNLHSIFLGNAYIAVAAIGMSMVIISGNIDISVGSLIGVLATLSGSLAVAGYPILVSWLVPLLVGALVTGFMGFLVAYLRIPSIVVTLGMLSILKGGLISVTAGAWITDLPAGYALAQMRPLGIPMPIWFMVVLTLGAALWMRSTATGRAIYAVGGNAEAARVSGISRRRTIMTVFLIHGVFVGIASVLFATQLSVIQSTVPPNLELTIITATVVGGVSILGGTGTVVGATLAAILLAAIGSSLIFVSISPYWLRAVQGVLILITVLADLMRRRRQALAR
jgi:ribose/xylose/arabinose/galactoside ABC-type transport system permease subunit